jgi:hypothetical protein
LPSRCRKHQGAGKVIQVPVAANSVELAVKHVPSLRIRPPRCRSLVEAPILAYYEPESEHTSLWAGRHRSAPDLQTRWDGRQSERGRPVQRHDAARKDHQKPGHPPGAAL